ncbi:MAG: hypothetical protein ACYC3I_26310 [Gemmataceae bacterium]
MNPRQITDPKGSVNNCPPLAEEILGEAAELLSFWPVIRSDPRLAPHTAADLLAVWAHLRRFPSADVAGEIMDRLDRLIDEERDRLATLFLRLSAPALDEAIVKLNRAWDSLKSWDACEELERETRDLFDALDRQSLAVYALQQLVPPEDSRRPDIEEPRRKVEKAEQTLLQYAESFYPAASLATAMLEEYRMDLAKADRALWMTTVKYRRMADLYEEEEAPSDLDAWHSHDEVAHPRPQEGTKIADTQQRTEAHPRRGHPRDVLPQYQLAAGEKKAGIGILRCWDAPDGRFYAYLRIPPEPAQKLVVQLFNAADESAKELVGQMAYLAGQPAEGKVDEQGQVNFDWQAVQDRGEDLWFAVGAQSELWTLSEE